MLNSTWDCKLNECLFLAKRSSTTAIVWAAPSETKSTVRSLLPGGQYVITQEWAVHCACSDSLFSTRGDSGAAIVDIDGRLGGFICMGAGSPKTSETLLQSKMFITDDLMDIKYVTPAALVMEDIEKELGQSVKIL
ncbi:hypothetical protein CMQ_4639 [Grosmannia clavigera kw1407]|uniref:Uncharacterized protein n=1 Tax=Grosmannia clavigera (strain kw1407 / UAMH 11150) TaxID=655863 RepID=F0XUK1_GROCL|nr:uncharacterized protein CMQ_4639 [Grosmannia clavigera kw1407]EFW98787.1 hypothetical protein CMQ_4639 [Grosmannia clavigera kw1407]